MMSAMVRREWLLRLSADKAVSETAGGGSGYAD
jgi:hypothetical protein